MKSFFLALTLCFITQSAFAACDITQTIKSDLESMFGSIAISKVKVSTIMFDASAPYIAPSSVKVTHLVYFETESAEVQGLPIQKNSYIGAYNLEEKNSCRPRFLGAQ